jgi:transposase
MVRDRITVAKESSTQTARGAKAIVQPKSADRYPVHTAIRYSVGNAATGDGMRIWHDVLATIEELARARCVGSIASGSTCQAAWRRPLGLWPRNCRQFIDTRRGGGKKTGPNPTDRRRAGSKHHILTDAQGIPLNVILTGANAHDVTQLLPLVDGIAPVAGKPGRPKRKPDLVQADRGYDSAAHRRALAQRGIESQIAKRRTKHGSGLGVTRWVVERTFAWLHQFRRLRIRYERLANIHEAFLKLGCCLICWRSLKNN